MKREAITKEIKGDNSKSKRIIMLSLDPQTELFLHFLAGAIIETYLAEKNTIENAKG